MEEKKKKSGRLITIVLIAVLVIGALIFLYPFLSDWWNGMQQTSEIRSYEETVTGFTPEECEEMFRAAEDYNERLAENPGRYSLSEEDIKEYNNLLDVTGTGIMGTVTIPKINVDLPVYHGTSEKVLQTSVGHLEGTSLPTGGEGTHTVITAHRGLPTARLFTDIDQLEEGDRFTVKVLDRTLVYEVDQIRTVLPDEMQDLAIDPEEDYCTLVTCTPYGVNTHRLLVRGTRTLGSTADYETESYRPDPLLMAPLIAAPIALIVLIVILVLVSRRRKRRE